MGKSFMIFFLLIVTKDLFSQQDQFAKIGGQQYEFQKGLLIEPSPVKHSNQILPSGINISHDFNIPNRIETKESLYKELDSLKKMYALFLLNKSPMHFQSRTKLVLDKMNWRKGSEEDEHQTIEKISQTGNWEEVNIPHYGPPLGHAVTFYSKEVFLADSMFNRDRIYFCFKGVDYKAELYVNGIYSGSHEGFFAPFEFDITSFLKKGKNQFVIKVFNEPTTTGSSDGLGNHVVGNKIYAAGGPGYDEPIEGWHICPPAMGIYQDCFIESRSEIFIKDIFVRPNPQQSTAEVWVEVFNAGMKPQKVTIDLSVFGRNFVDTVFSHKIFNTSTTIVPGIGDMVKPTDWQQKELLMEYGVNYLRLPIKFEGFKWWTQDKPWLYNLHAVIVSQDGKSLDEKSATFGMRSFTMDTLNIPKGKMFLNGNPIRLRGANSMGFEQQDVMKKNWDQLINDILLAKLCNMNFFRFTQRPVQPEVYEYCDMLGMLNQTDLPFFGAIRINQLTQAVKQAEEMERLIRSHPSSIMVTYLNERFPNAEGSPHRSFASSDEIHAVFKALDQAVLLSNPDRVIKPSDGDYNPPAPGLPDNHCYNTWYNGHAMDLGKFIKGYWQLIKPDWLYGCGEFGAEGLDPLNTMQKYYPKEWLPQNEDENRSWLPSSISKAQSFNMHHMWYPTPKGLQSWIDESQSFQSWAVKTVAEEFRRDDRNVSFAVHLFIDAWPAGWMKAIMDVDRQPKKAFFAYRNALVPLMVSMRTDRNYWYAGDKAEMEFWICNDKNIKSQNITLVYEVLIDGRPLVKQSVPASVPINGSEFQGNLKFLIPAINKRSIAKVRSGLFDENGKCIHSNEQELVIYPAFKSITQKTMYFPSKESKSESLASDLKAPLVNGIEKAELVIIDNFQDYQSNKKQMDEFVSRGGKILFTEIPEGEYKIATTNVSVKHTIMGEYYFANPTVTLTKKETLGYKDLFMWYDRRKDYIQPLLANVFKANEWTPMVTTGLCNFSGADPSGYLASATYSYGKGKFIFCEMKLSRRIKENPPALELFNQLINK